MSMQTASWIGVVWCAFNIGIVCGAVLSGWLREQKKSRGSAAAEILRAGHRLRAEVSQGAQHGKVINGPFIRKLH